MTEPSQPTYKPHLGQKRVKMAIGVAAVAAILIGLRIHAASGLRERTEDNAILTVSVIQAAADAKQEEVVLPATVKAWHEAPIYARTNGYLKNWITGLGTHVKAGDLMAEIETPEIDSQLRQAEADLATAKANNMLAQSTSARWKSLLKSDSVSKQDADEKLGDAAAKEALMNSAQANVDRLRDMENFKRVLAPFDGVVTQRLTDIGQLITSGSTTGQILFRLAQTETLRVYVQVPQIYARIVNPDLQADLIFPEHADKHYTAKLYHTADAIDPDARTLLIEFLIDNKDGALLSGGYIEAHLKVPTTDNAIRIPVNTLLFRAEGSEVVTVDKEGRTLLKPVKIGRDFGNDVEISSGIEKGESIIVNPPDSMMTGQQVRIAQPAAPKEEKKS